MALPITIPNTFGGATVPIPLSQLDNNFSTVVNGINGIGNGTNSLANVSITGGTINAANVTNAAVITGTSITATNLASGNVSITGGSIANVTLTNTVTAPTFGYRRNRIINGGMQIDQRNNGAAQTVVAGSSVYTLDRWVVSVAGGNVTAQRVAGPTSYQYALQVTGAAGVTALVVQQRIESSNIADLVNQNVTLSAVIANSLLTTVGWSVYSANSVDNWGAQTLIASGSFTVSSTATTYTATFSAGANAANGILINFSVGAQTSGTLAVTGVQLEPGSSNTPFERLPIGEMLALCQRYYEYGGVWQQANGSAGSVGNWIGYLVSKRTAPTLAFVNTAYTNASTLAFQTITLSPTTGVGYNFIAGSGSSNFTSNWTASSEL